MKVLDGKAGRTLATLCVIIVAAIGIASGGTAQATPAATPPAPPSTQVWGVGIPGANVTVYSGPGVVGCSAVVNKLGTWECSISMPTCTINLKATESLIPASLPLTFPIPKPFCKVSTGTKPPHGDPKPPTKNHPQPSGSPTTALPQHPTLSVPSHRGGASATPSKKHASARPQPTSARAISSVRTIAGAGSALATWSGSGEPGTTYTATATPGGAHCSTQGSQCLITGLSNGTPYFLEVVATRARHVVSRVSTTSPIVPSPDASRMSFTLALATGKGIGGTASTVSGHGLMPGSKVAITVHSTPQLLGTFTVADDGSFSSIVTLPHGLPSGKHALIARGVGLNGAPLSSRADFVVTPQGWAFASYDPRNHPDQTIKTLTAGFGLVMIAGGLGAIQRRRQVAPVAPKTRSGKKPSVSMSHQEFRAEAIEPGDRSRTWTSPFRMAFDKASLVLPNRLNVLSPLIARLFNDAAYLRAMFGTWALLSPLAGLALGVAAAANTDGQALPPHNALLFAIVLLSIADALAGIAAATTFSLGVLFSGGLNDAASLRSLIAIDVIFFAIILVVSATRRLRREPAITAEERYDRLADFVIGTAIAVWTIQSAVAALPAFTGLDLPIAHSTATLLWLVAGGTMIRFGLETLAAHWYPERLLMVAPEEISAPPAWRAWLAIATKIVLFLFFAYSYMGNEWQLWACATLLFLSLAMPRWKAHFPDWPAVARVVPAGIIGLLFYFLLGAWASYALKANVSAATVSEFGAPLLMLPAIVCAAIVLTARNGEGWKLTWFWRIMGIPMLTLTILVVSGIVPVT